MKLYILKCDICEITEYRDLTEEQLNQITTNPHKYCTKTPHGRVSAKEIKMINKPIPKKYKEKLEEQRPNFEFNLVQGSEDIIVYFHQSLEEKIEFVNLLCNKALKFMKEPEMVSPDEYRFVSNLDIIVNRIGAFRNQDYSCLLCGIGVNPRLNVSVRDTVANDVLGLQAHKIVHRVFKGDYVPENIVILCDDCHEKESKLFNKDCNKFLENGRVMVWEKVVEKSFKFFNFYLSSQEKQISSSSVR